METSRSYVHTSPNVLTYDSSWNFRFVSSSSESAGASKWSFSKHVTSTFMVGLHRKALCFNRNIFIINELTISPAALHKRANSSLALSDQWKNEKNVLRSACELKRRIISSTNFNAQFLYSLTIWHNKTCKARQITPTYANITMKGTRVRSQPVFCADVYRQRRYQMLCEYNFSSWRWAC